MNDKYVEEKIKECYKLLVLRETGQPHSIADFIRTIVEECKVRVSKAFIGKITARIYCDRKSVRAIKTNVREAFEEAGVEVEK